LDASNSAADVPPDEFVIVQGVVDLAVIRPREIWIVDFKTDDVSRAGLPGKVELYAPQLHLYAAALAQIYARTVTRLTLHFLAPGRTVDVLALAKSGKKP
jgi:ATP-dependent exoDNAse (exonuclease V) beta subunit